jgi:hypothetical protein
MKQTALELTAAWLAFCLPYGIAGLGLVAWQERIARAARAGTPAPALGWFRGASVAYFFAPILPAAWVAFAPLGMMGAVGHGNFAFLAAALAVVVPQLLVGGIVLWLAQRADHLAARPSNTRELLAAMLRAGAGLAGITLISLLILAVGIRPDFVVGALVALPPLAVLFAGARLARAAVPFQSVSVVEMDDTPLCSEIIALGRHFGGRAKAVKVRTVKPRESAGPASEAFLAMALANWTLSCRPGDPVISLTVFQQVDPDALTAGLAVSYARRFSRNPLVRALRGILRGRVAFAVVFAAVYAASLTVYLSSVIYGGGRLWLGVGATLLLLYAAARAARHRMRYETAFKAWRESDPCSARSAEDFIAALAHHDLATTRTAEPRALLNLIRQNRTLQRFAAIHGPATLEAALQRVGEGQRRKAEG